MSFANFADYKRQMCAALGIKMHDVRVEREPHPSKRAHWVYRISHHYYGEGVAQLQEHAWNAFFSAAEKKKKKRLPDNCPAVTKTGTPCKSKPQRGEAYCGPHLPKGSTAARRTPLPGKCQAKTKKGTPCANSPQKGELYCGPHLARQKR